jgi:hypothetical protein
MTLDKFYETLRLISNLDQKLGLQATLEQIRDNLANLANSPAAVQFQSSLATGLSSLSSAAEILRNSISPSERSAITEIGGEEFFDPLIAERVQSAVSANAMTPSVARDFAKDLATRRAAFLNTVEGTLTGLESLGVDNHQGVRAPADLAFLIPRDLFENRVDAFAKELKFISKLIQDFGEAVTGEAEPAKLEALSSSVPTIAIVAGVGVISAIGTAVNKFLSAWEKVENIRRLRQELSEVSVKKQALNELTEEITTTIEEVVEESTTLTLTSYKGDSARRNELRTAVQQDLHRLFAQIERGLTIEFRARPEEENDQPGSDALANIDEIARTIQFPTVLREPILLDNGRIIEGEFEAVGSSKKTTTQKKTTTSKKSRNSSESTAHKDEG